MSKVELEAKVEALNDEINFFKTLYETVRTLGVGAVACLPSPNRGAIWFTPCSGPARVLCAGTHPALYPFWTQESVVGKEFGRSCG